MPYISWTTFSGKSIYKRQNFNPRTPRGLKTFTNGLSEVGIDKTLIRNKRLLADLVARQPEEENTDDESESGHGEEETDESEAESTSTESDSGKKQSRRALQWKPCKDISCRKETSCTKGRYRYLRMPFGVSLAPEEFECKLHEKLDDLQGIEVLRDDILVLGCGETREQAEKNHDENLIRLLDRAREVKLKLNKDKMNLKREEVKFMGHIITANGLKPDPAKVSAIQEMPRPTCKKELMTLLGFISYLSKFLPRLSDVVQPLRDLTAKDAQFLWSHQHDKAFQEVKELVVQHPVLKYYNIEEEVTLQCDASEFGLGATLLQNGQPVAFASRTLTATQRNYAQIEKECLAIVFGCQRFNQYIARREKVTIESDHKPLQAIFKKSILSAPSRLQRMLLRLQRHNLDVCYKPGKEMHIADHLSRAPMSATEEEGDEFEVFTIELDSNDPYEFIQVKPERLAHLQKCTGQDPVLQTLKDTVLAGWPERREQAPEHISDYWNYRDEITVHNGVLFKSQRPMQTQPVPDRPWSRLSADIFTLKGKEYISLVDHYSDFIEAVVEGVKEKIKLKKQKAKYYHDRTAKTLPELEVGQDIRVAPTSKYQQWSIEVD
ncbi:hypothetical protein QZH41_003831 [Actinostola sp. cb2023]|nr:hypothetical protein QZH41_003831 [Actinostola sp. cb2023]